MPDGYSSNLAKCADINNGKLRGMKSHDSHVLMERLLRIPFCSLPNHVINPLTEISHFFKDLCASTLRMGELVKIDQNIPIILCKLEKVFPPAFFDSMEHLPMHLAYETMLGGFFQYRWMYPFEWFMDDSKRTVKNKAWVEGSICASYLHLETSHFSSHYFNNLMLTLKSTRNEVVDEFEMSPSILSVFRLPGHPSRSANNYLMNDVELKSAAVHVMINCNEVRPFLDKFHGLNIGNTYSNFSGWFSDEVLKVEPTLQIALLRGLAEGPQRLVKEWHTYVVNGFKFHTQLWTMGKKTIN